MSAEKLIEATNAKHSSSIEISDSFVPSEHFDAAIVNGHSILLGPRGSGKTTILRMLSNQILPDWKDGRAEYYRSRIAFEGIYIRGDRVWGEMIKELEKPNFENEQVFDKRKLKDFAKVLSIAAFNSHVFSATMSALKRSFERYITSCSPEETKQTKTKVLGGALKQIAETLELKNIGLSFDSISYALEKRFQEISTICYQLSLFPEMLNSEKIQNLTYLYIQLPSTLTLILSCFDKCLNREDHKWALLLDEFEIAPLELQQTVLNDLRSSNKKYIYKVALIPCGAFTEHTRHGGMQSSINNDYSTIRLWHTHKKNIQDFCISFIEKRYGCHPREIFGETKFASKANDFDRWNQRWLPEFYNLKKKDSSFVKYLENKRISLEDVAKKPQLLEYKDRLRKIAPLVAFRNALMAEHDSVQSRRSRKALIDFYTGWQALIEISEGNPRWLNIILNEISIKDGEKPSLSDQLAGITQVSQTFNAMIATAALVQNMGVTTKTAPMKLIHDISKAFLDRLLNENFSEDPSLSFKIDDKIDFDTIQSLRIAFNYGAIVPRESSSDINDYHDLKGKNFRISYLLAPTLSLPLKSERPIALSSLLSKAEETKVLDLFSALEGDLFNDI